MATSSIERLAIDGSRVGISAEGLDVSGPPTSSITVVAFGRQIEFTAAIDRAVAAAQVAATSEVELTDRLSYQGGELRSGTRTFDDGSFTAQGIWEGARTSLFTAAVPGASANDLIALFDLGAISEVEGGLVFAIKEGSSVAIHQPASLVLGIEGLGVVGTQRLNAGRTPTQVPREPGTPVAGGDLYVEHARDNNATVLYIYGDTAVSSVVADTRLPEQDLIGAASKLVVNWF